MVCHKFWGRKTFKKGKATKRAVKRKKMIGKRIKSKPPFENNFSSEMYLLFKY